MRLKLQQTPKNMMRQELTRKKGRLDRECSCGEKTNINIRLAEFSCCSGCGEMLYPYACESLMNGQPYGFL